MQPRHDLVLDLRKMQKERYAGVEGNAFPLLKAGLRKRTVFGLEEWG